MIQYRETKRRTTICAGFSIDAAAEEDADAFGTDVAAETTAAAEMAAAAGTTAAAAAMAAAAITEMTAAAQIPAAATTQTTATITAIPTAAATRRPTFALHPTAEPTGPDIMTAMPWASETAVMPAAAGDGATTGMAVIPAVRLRPLRRTAAAETDRVTDILLSVQNMFTNPTNRSHNLQLY